MTVGIALRPFASHVSQSASALVISADGSGALRFERRCSMALASCLHRLFRVCKTRQHRDANAASLRTLLRHIEAQTGAAVRARVEQGRTRLPGDRGEGFTVGERIARGSFVSAALLRQIDTLCQQALTQENSLAIDRFLGVAPSGKQSSPSGGLRLLLDRVAREGTMASEEDGIRIWAQPASDYGNTWAHLRNALVPGPDADLSDDALESQLADCDRALHLPVKPTRSRVLEVFHDALDAVCSFFQSHDAHTSPQMVCIVRDNRLDLIHERRRREFLGLLRHFLRAQLAAHAGSGRYFDDSTLARMCASYLSRPAIFRSFVKAYNRHQVAMLLHGDSCPNAIAALVRQCDTAIDPQQRDGIDQSDLVALADGLEAWQPNRKEEVHMLGEDGEDKSYVIAEICEAVAEAVAGLVLSPPHPRTLKARMDELKTQPRELTSTDLVRAAFPVLRPLLEERHRGALARRAAEIEMTRSYADRMRELVAVYPILAPWAAKSDLRPGTGAACGLLALDLVIPHILDPLIYAGRRNIQETEERALQRSVDKQNQLKTAIIESFYADASAENARARNTPQDHSQDGANGTIPGRIRDQALEDTREKLQQVDRCIEAARNTTLLRITARGRECERELTRMVERNGALWQACKVLQEYAEAVGACASPPWEIQGATGRQPIAGTTKALRKLQRRIPLVVACLAPLEEAYAEQVGPQLNVLIEAVRSIEPRLWLDRDGTPPSEGALARRSAPRVSVWGQLVRPLLTGKGGSLPTGMAALAVSAGRTVARAIEDRR